MITGNDLINYIKENNLGDAPVMVTATVYRHGDHNCNSTTDISLMVGSFYNRTTKKDVRALDLYVDDSL